MTHENMSRSVAALLVASALLLGVLVPGGPIETRSFAHIAPLVLGSFNTFLTTLGIGSFAFAYFVLKHRHWAFMASAVCGILYFLVYALDLGKIFPVSPDEMPTALFAIEATGTLVSFPLTCLSLKLAHMRIRSDGDRERVAVMKKEHILLLGIMVLAGIGIITFATLSAMGR